MLFGRIDHVGVAVEDLDAAIELYGSRFDMREQHRETVEEQGVEAVLLEIGDGHVELLRPLSEDTAVGKFLSKRGPGLHHVAYQTDDIDRTLGAAPAPGALAKVTREPSTAAALSAARASSREWTMTKSSPPPPPLPSSSPACGGGSRWGMRGFSAVPAGSAEAGKIPHPALPRKLG